jgi:hypothetical protein
MIIHVRNTEHTAKCGAALGYLEPVFTTPDLAISAAEEGFVPKPCPFCLNAAGYQPTVVGNTND